MTAAERRLQVVLRALAGVLLGAAVVYALGPLVGPAREFFREPPFVSNSAVKVTILALIALYAAGDIRRRLGLVRLLIAAHLVSVAAMASMLAFADTGRIVDIGFGHPTIATVLWGAIALDGVITGVIAVLYLAARRSTRRFAIDDSPEQEGVLTPPERLMRTLLVVFTVLFALGAVAYAVGPLLNSSKAFSRELPFVTNSVVKVSALAMVCAYAAANLRRNLALVGPVIAVHFLSVLVQLLYLIFLDTDYTLPLLGGHPRMTSVLWGAIVLDSLIGAVVLLLAYRAAWRARYRLAFLQPMEYRALIALADVLVVGRDEKVPPEDVAANVEAYVRNVRAHRRWVYRACLAGAQVRPLLTLRAPLSELDPEGRRHFLEAHFQRPPRWPPFLKHVTQIMIRVCQQLTYAGYYNDPRSFASIGYQPFTERPRYRQLGVPEPGPHPLAVERPENIGVLDLETDVCIVGSGAGGGILAYRLAEAGHDVLVLERGRYVEPRHFSENEVEMIGALYADGVMQQTEDFRFTVLQGSCVGGSTAVNNAVSFAPPEPVLANWNDPALHDAGLDLDRLRKNVTEAEAFVDVTRQSGIQLNPSGRLYVDGARKLGLMPGALDVDVVRANIKGCYGSGYCNIGCKWGKKLSMLETALPWAQRDFPGRVRIIAECEVERLLTLSGDVKSLAGLRARLSDGRGLRVRANKYVISAGAIGSSYLLLRSGVARGLPVGKKLSFNMGAPLTAEFDGEPLNAYDGLQISHYGVPRDNGFVFETWFNPPVAQALNMPGWFERHFDNMRRYDHMMAVGVLVGTAGNGYVKRALFGGPGIVFRPKPEDLKTLARGLRMLGEILFAAGAKRVMLNTWGYDEFRSAGELDALERICADPDYVTLGTGHPQGGNAISRDPKRGVVGPDFRVHGYRDLYICDASVFPSSLSVNPQLTVMSLAHYAAPLIAA